MPRCSIPLPSRCTKLMCQQNTKFQARDGALLWLAAWLDKTMDRLAWSLLRTDARRHTDVRSESVHGRRGSDHQPTIDQNDNPREDGQFSWQGTRAWAWCVLLALPPRLPMPPRGVNPRVPRKNVVSKPVLPPIGGLAAPRTPRHPPRRAAANRTVRYQGRQAAAAARRRQSRPRPTMERRRRPSRALKSPTKWLCYASPLCDFSFPFAAQGSS